MNSCVVHESRQTSRSATRSRLLAGRWPGFLVGVPQGTGNVRSLPKPDAVTQAAIRDEPAPGQQPAEGGADH